MQKGFDGNRQRHDLSSCLTPRDTSFRPLARRTYTQQRETKHKRDAVHSPSRATFFVS